MKIRYRLLIIITALVCVCASVCAQTGASCDEAIRLTADYSAQITGAGVKWYVANTFDLPLTVRFYPQHNSDPEPDLELDFSCTSGVYEDSILCSLFCRNQSVYISLPHRAEPTRRVDDEGHVYYEVAMGEFYRNMLLSAGISYDIDVFVKVTYYGGGNISLTPDAEFSQCMDTDKWLLLGRTLTVAADDEETFFIAPYANWQNDSVRYIWSGSAPATVVVGTTCLFEPMNALDDRRIDVMPMQAGGDTVNQPNSLIREYINTYMNAQTNAAQGGIFYVKAVSTDPGTLKVERMPMPPPAGGATILEYNRATTVPANNTQLFAFPVTWRSAMRFDTPSDHVFQMYIGANANVTPETAIGVYQFNRTEEGHWWGLTEDEMSALWAEVSSSQKYLYVRFVCTETTTITPTIWSPSDCMQSTILIEKGATIDIETRSKQIYRIFYNDWKDGDLTASWNKSAVCRMLVADTCEIGTNGSSDAISFYHELTSSSPAEVPMSEMADWTNIADGDGYIYLRFFTTSNAGGKVTMSSTAPAEVDPEPVVYPAATIHVACDGIATDAGQGFIIRVSKPQTLNLYSGPADNIASRTPIQTIDMTTIEEATTTLQTGVYTLIGESEMVQIEVK